MLNRNTFFSPNPTQAKVMLITQAATLALAVGEEIVRSVATGKSPSEIACNALCGGTYGAALGLLINASAAALNRACGVFNRRTTEADETLLNNIDPEKAIADYRL